MTHDEITPEAIRAAVEMMNKRPVPAPTVCFACRAKLPEHEADCWIVEALKEPK